MRCTIKPLCIPANKYKGVYYTCFLALWWSNVCLWGSEEGENNSCVFWTKQHKKKLSPLAAPHRWDTGFGVSWGRMSRCFLNFTQTFNDFQMFHLITIGSHCVPSVMCLKCEQDWAGTKLLGCNMRSDPPAPQNFKSGHILCPWIHLALMETTCLAPCSAPSCVFVPYWWGVTMCTCKLHALHVCSRETYKEVDGVDSGWW